MVRISTDPPSSQASSSQEENVQTSPESPAAPTGVLLTEKENFPLTTHHNSFDANVLESLNFSRSTTAEALSTSPTAPPTSPIPHPLSLIPWLNEQMDPHSQPGSPSPSTLPSTSASASASLTKDSNLLEGATAESPSRADEGKSPQNTSSLESFLDVLNEEIQLQEKGEKRRTDILIHQGYEHMRDRPGDRSNHNQYWHCRHKAKQKCKARLTLRVKDLNNITKDATIDNFVPHCHPPYHMKSYGTAEVSVIHSTDASLGNATADGTGKSNHAISQLSEGDFNQDNLISKACSSPAAGKRSTLQHDPTQSAHMMGSSVDITTLGINTSQVDARGYPITKFVSYKGTYRDRSPIKKCDGDSSD